MSATRESSAVELTGVGEQLRGIRIPLAKSDETRLDDSPDAHQHTFIRDEDLVAIDRDWFPWRLVFFPEPRPLPLVRMTVVVADEHVDFTGRQQCSCIDAR